MLRDGKGVALNKEKAIEWFRMAEKQGYKDAGQQAMWVKTGRPSEKKAAVKGGSKKKNAKSASKAKPKSKRK